MIVKLKHNLIENWECASKHLEEDRILYEENTTIAVVGSVPKKVISHCMSEYGAVSDPFEV